MKNLPRLLPLFFAFFALLPAPVSAQAELADKTLSPYFLVRSQSTEIDQLPLKSTAAEVNIAGVIADVMVTQMYVNNGKKPLEAIYVFPGSTNAAVYGMGMQIGRRIIKAKIAEKQQARQQYEQAKTEGKRASLLEQDRPNVFTMNVANIMPGDTIRVILRYTELLVPEEGVYQFVYPTVVGPRYTDGQEKDNNGFTAMPYLHQGEKPGYTFDLSVRVAAGMPLQDVYSPSHQVQVNYNGLNEAGIRLDASEKQGGNRDFILNYSLRGGKIETGLLLYDDGKEKFFLCMAQPPKRIATGDIPPRDYIIVMDVSGSMNGYPLDVAKKLLRNLVVGLNPQDRFNVILFARTSNIMADQSVAATPENVERAIGFFSRQDGNGSTNLLPALKRALSLPRSTEGLSRSILVITDGYVSIEKEAFDLVRTSLGNSNLFAFGIGSGVNRFLVEGLAHAGSGVPYIVTKPEESDAVAEKFRKYVATPVLTQIAAKFDGFEAYDMEPVSIPDVMADRPVILFGKYRGTPRGTIKLQGYSGDQPFRWDNAFGYAKSMLFNNSENRKVTVSFKIADAAPDARNSALKYLWARERIKYLDDYREVNNNPERVAAVTALGLEYNLLTAYTSFIAIEEIPTNDDPSGLKTVKQALPLPENVSDMAVGFDLGIEGISGLMKVQGTDAALSGTMAVMALSILLLLFAFYYRRRLISNRKTFLIALLIVSGLSSCSHQPIVYTDTDSITFLLGEDRNARNLYFAKAKTYFRDNPSEKTTRQITGCQSLLDVRDYLSLNRPKTGPWRRINLVVHGNEWTGINIPVMPGVPRTTLKTLETAIGGGDFPPLPDGLADSATQILVHGCNIGRDEALLRMLSRAFGGDDAQCPTVRSARFFNVFDVSRENSETVQRYLADYRYVMIPAGKFPGNGAVAKELASKYPADTTDWKAALQRLKPDAPGQSYVHYFNVPVKWTTVYPDTNARPALATEQARLAWVATQTELMAELNSMAVCTEAFRWTIQPLDFPLENGQTAPALAVQGDMVIYCIIQPLKSQSRNTVALLNPEVTNGDYYAAARFSPVL